MHIMKKIKIGYVHGYLGSSNGTSFQRLSKFLPEDCELIGIDYDDSDPENAINDLRARVKNEGFDMLIGSSLGGFYVLNVWGIPRIVINPCYRPSIELPKIGNDELSKNIKFPKFEKDLVKYSEPEERENVSAVFGEHDELLGLRYLEEYKKDFKYAYVIDSGHQISEDGASFLMRNIVRETFFRANTYADFIRKMNQFEI